jgi:carboxymethylenebutenolidase
VTTLDIPVDGGTLPADLHLPAAGRGPGIVLFQEIFGVSPYITRRAEDLAALGYVVLVPHLFWREGDPVLEGLEEAMAVLGRLDQAAAVTDGLAALAALRARPEVEGPTGLFGFCFGGGVVFAVAAAADPDFLVSYYGSALPQLLDRAPAVTAPSLHHFGLADDYLPPDVVERITAAVTPQGATVLTYPGAGHAFDSPNPMFRHAEAAERAWAATVGWLAEQAPVPQDR